MVFVFRMRAALAPPFRRFGGSLSRRHPGEGRDPVASCLLAKDSPFVIPAEAGIHLRLFCLRVFAKTDSRPCVIPSAILAAGSLSLLPRESNQREGTRVGRRRFAPVRYGRPGFR